jgi:hypothetical protein
MFSHTYPTFATETNIIVEKWEMLYHQPDLTIQQDFCQLWLPCRQLQKWIALVMRIRKQKTAPSSWQSYKKKS